MKNINNVAIILLLMCTALATSILFIISPKKQEKNIESTYIEETESSEIEIDFETSCLPNEEKNETLPLETEPIYIYTPVEMLHTSSAKTYMDYRAITDMTSNQYRLIHSDKIKICDDGFLRDEEGFIGVALGSKFGPIGSRYICHMDNGKDLKVIKVEAKSDAHTVNGFCGSTSYEIVEFVIDTESKWMRDNIWGNGYVFCGNFNNCKDLSGKIINIDKVEKNF